MLTKRSGAQAHNVLLKHAPKKHLSCPSLKSQLKHQFHTNPITQKRKSTLDNPQNAQQLLDKFVKYAEETSTDTKITTQGYSKDSLSDGYSKSYTSPAFRKMDNVYFNEQDAEEDEGEFDFSSLPSLATALERAEDFLLHGKTSPKFFSRSVSSSMFRDQDNEITADRTVPNPTPDEKIQQEAEEGYNENEEEVEEEEEDPVLKQQIEYSKLHTLKVSEEAIDMYKSFVAERALFCKVDEDIFLRDMLKQSEEIPKSHKERRRRREQGILNKSPMQRDYEYFMKNDGLNTEELADFANSIFGRAFDELSVVTDPRKLKKHLEHQKIRDEARYDEYEYLFEKNPKTGRIEKFKRKLKEENVMKSLLPEQIDNGEAEDEEDEAADEILSKVAGKPIDQLTGKEVEALQEKIEEMKERGELVAGLKEDEVLKSEEKVSQEEDLEVMTPQQLDSFDKLHQRIRLGTLDIDPSRADLLSNSEREKMIQSHLAQQFELEKENYARSLNPNLTDEDMQQLFSEEADETQLRRLLDKTLEKLQLQKLAAVAKQLTDDLGGAEKVMADIHEKLGIDPTAVVPLDLVLGSEDLSKPMTAEQQGRYARIAAKYGDASPEKRERTEKITKILNEQDSSDSFQQFLMKSEEADSSAASAVFDQTPDAIKKAQQAQEDAERAYLEMEEKLANLSKQLKQESK